MGDYEQYKEFVDVTGGMGRVMNNAMIYKKIMNSFLTSTYFDEFCEQVKNNDPAAVGTIHTLKGVTANLSLPKANEYCINVEAKVKNGENVEGDLDGFAEIMAKTAEYAAEVVNSL